MSAAIRFRSETGSADEIDIAARQWRRTPTLASGRLRSDEGDLVALVLRMTPQLIPTDVRLAALRAALRQSDDPYMRIAALVGFQERGPVRVPDDEWPAVRDELLDAARDPRAAIRSRATVTLSGRLRPDDAPAVVELIREGALDASELDTLVATLVKLGADAAVLEILPIALERGTQGPTLAWLEAWQATGGRPAEPAPRGFGLPVLGYIPNLDE